MVAILRRRVPRGKNGAPKFVDSGPIIGQYSCRTNARKEESDERKEMLTGTGRDDRDEAIPGSAPIASALEAPPALSFAPLHFDAAEFIRFVESEGLTEAEAVTLLHEVWKIVVGFVDIGWGIHPVQQVPDNSTNSDKHAAPAARGVLGSKHQFNQVTKSKPEARGSTRARRRRIHEDTK